MSQLPKCPVIAIEEHYWDAELMKQIGGPGFGSDPDLEKRLYDFTGIRLQEMDAAGVDIQVLSHGAPSGQRLPADAGPDIVRAVNDRLAEKVAANPKRLAAFAALATANPQAAADELERAVTKLGLKGAMLHGMTNGEFLDLPKYWPIYERAEALDVPVYFHPALPHPAVTEAYYKDYVKDFPMVIRPAWGFTVETGTQAIRMVLSGVFEKHPKLKVILGHLGETLPFLMGRIDEALKRPGQKQIDFRSVFSRNFYVTTSGFFSTPALLCTLMEMGVDHILFAIDWPFVMNPVAMDWIRDAPLSQDDKIKILSGNARRLLKM